MTLRPTHLIAQAQLAVMLLSRLPAGWLGQGQDQPVMAQSVWAFPLVGALIGGGGGAALAAGAALGLPLHIAAVLAVGAAILATGALHEDGLADLADGFGGGRDRARKLDIMRDSRIGSYGALALGLILALRVMAIAALAQFDLGTAILALIAIEAASRVGMTGLLWALPAAREQGLGHAASGVTATAMGAAALLGAALLFVCLGLGAGAVVAAAMGLVQCALGLLAYRQIGGQTGDVLGASQQLGAATGLMAALVYLT